MMSRSLESLRALAPERLQTWGSFVTIFMLTLAIGALSVFAFILIVDPYDTGRFGSWMSGNVENDLQTAEVSLGRDEHFDSAVIGNSHGLMIDPTRLSQATGLRFVQLTVQGTRVREDMAILRWFLRHHAHVGAIVLIADPGWCSFDPALSSGEPFPFWLYGDSNLNYALHAFQIQAAGRAWRRALVAVGLRKAAALPIYRDYEIGHVWAFSPTVPDHFSVPDSSARLPHQAFPAIEALGELLGQFAPAAPLVVAFSPVFVTALPASAVEANLIGECKGAFGQLTAGRGAYFDFALDGDIARDPRNFMDTNHFRSGVARSIEAKVITALDKKDGTEK